MKKLFTCLLVLVLSSFMVACNSDNPDTVSTENEKDSTTESVQAKDTEKPLNIEVLEAGYYMDDHDVVHYAVRLTNPNEGYEAQSVKVIATGKMNDGTVVYSQDAFVEFMLPSEEIWFAGEAFASQEADYVEFEVKMRDNNWVANENPYVIPYKVANTSISELSYGGLRCAGEFTVNKTWSDVSNARVNLVLKDGQGTPVGGAYTFVDVYGEGDIIPFEVTLTNVVPFDSYEVCVIPGL